jgi:hypothetical protein
MRKFLITLVTISISAAVLSASQTGVQVIRKNFSDNVPEIYSTSYKTFSIDYGCPVNDEFIKGDTEREVIQNLESQCRKGVERASVEKALHIISIRTIFPDLQMAEVEGGFRANGTIFLQATGFRNGSADK